MIVGASFCRVVHFRVGMLLVVVSAQVGNFCGAMLGSNTHRFTSQKEYHNAKDSVHVRDRPRVSRGD